MTLLLVFLLGAMAISFLCSILEATLMSTPLSFITMKEEEGYKPAAKFRQYKQDSSRPIAAILSLNTIANTVGAAGVGRQATLVFGSQWFGLVSAVVTLLILIFSEIIPKTIGTTQWKHLMGFTTRCLNVLVILLYPFVIVFEWFTGLISHPTEDAAVSREEVSAMANVAEEEEEMEVAEIGLHGVEGEHHLLAPVIQAFFQGPFLHRAEKHLGEEKRDGVLVDIVTD